MRFSIISTLTLLFASLLVASCSNEKKPEPVKPIELGKLTLKKSEGKDCDKVDSLRIMCAEVDLAWPEVKSGPEPLKAAVSAWANQFVVGMLAPEMDSVASLTAKVEDGAKGFFQMHAEFAQENPEAYFGSWSVESYDTVLLNDGKYLTLEIAAYAFMGGAHGNPVAAVGTFDAATGKVLSWDDLVTDKKKMQAIAEKKFREERADLFKPEAEGGVAYTFDETFPFKLPDNFGLTSEGIYCHYLHYEVTPYAFGNSVFVIPFSEIGDIYKLKK